MDTNPLLDWALYLGGRGWHVFPVTPGAKKPPVVRDWEHRATTDPDRITRCWSAGRYNIGIACGPSSLVVIDEDTDPTRGPDGHTGLAALARARDVPAPGDTFTVTTPRCGRHLYYTAPPGVHLRITQDDLAPNIDTRAEGGYVVAPGSVTGLGAYELVDDTDPAQLPAWLVQAIVECRATPRPVSSAVARPTAYGTTALRGECDRVREAPPTAHNAVLSSAAYRIGRLVGGEHPVVDEATARADLAAAAAHMVTADCDCTAREVDRVITAGLTAGARNPRTVERKAA